MLEIITLIIVLIFVILKYQSLFNGFENVDKMFPGPPKLPFLGNALTFIGDSHKAFNTGITYILLFRRSFRIWIGPVPYITLITPRDLEMVLSSTKVLRKGDFYDFMIPWIGRGLLTSFGTRWKKHRKALTPAFHFNILDNFLDVFNENAKILCQILEGQTGQKGFDVMKYMKLAALDNICEAAMGTKINSQNNPDSDYVKAVKCVCEVIYRRSITPWLRMDWFFALTTYGWNQKRALEVIHGLTNRVIHSKLNEKRSLSTSHSLSAPEDDCGIKRRRAFLDLLLDLNDEGTLTIDDVAEEVNTFMFEGHDTITSALSFTTHMLAHHPQYQEKVVEELKSIFGDDKRAPTLQDLQDMKYLEMVIKETLRMFSSVPVIGRTVEEDINLGFPLDDDQMAGSAYVNSLCVNSTRQNPWTIIPKGAQVVIPIVGLHRNPEIWEKPMDFYPEHFLPEACAKRHPFAYIPFSAGPRNCIGMKFAMMEMKSTISQVVRHFELMPVDAAIMAKPTVEVVLGSSIAFPIALKLRTTHIDKYYTTNV